MGLRAIREGMGGEREGGAGDGVDRHAHRVLYTRVEGRTDHPRRIVPPRATSHSHATELHPARTSSHWPAEARTKAERVLDLTSASRNVVATERFDRTRVAGAVSERQGLDVSPPGRGCFLYASLVRRRCPDELESDESAFHEMCGSG